MLSVYAKHKMPWSLLVIWHLYPNHDSHPFPWLFLCFWCKKVFILANIFLGMGMPHGCEAAFPGKEGGIQVLAGLAKHLEPYWKTPGRQSQIEKFNIKWVWLIHFNGKMRLATFDQMHLAKKEIWQSFLLVVEKCWKIR